MLYRTKCGWKLIESSAMCVLNNLYHSQTCTSWAIRSCLSLASLYRPTVFFFFMGQLSHGISNFAVLHVSCVMVVIQSASHCVLCHDIRFSFRTLYPIGHWCTQCVTNDICPNVFTTNFDSNGTFLMFFYIADTYLNWKSSQHISSRMFV